VRIVQFVALFLLLPASPTQARDVFVATTGDDEQAGSREAPYRTLQHAVMQLAPGDTCYLRRGRYHEVVHLRGVRGTAEAPITIRAFPGELAVLDGTIPIRSQWVRHRGHIWKTRLERDIWQLFVDNKNMTLARWPNSRYWTEEFWDQSTSWARSADVKKGYRDGLMVDPELVALPVSLAGGVVVINSDRWRSRAGTITSHEAGSDRFEFTPVKDFNRRDSHSYFVTALALLDAQDEWFYDRGSQTLYLYSQIDPAQRNVRGRVLDATLVHTPTPAKPRKGAALAPPACHLVLENLVFLGGHVDLRTLENLTIRDSHFLYTVASKRTLGVTKDAPYNAFDRCHNLKLINSTFRFCDGKALVANHANHARIENCLFHMVDFACLAGGSNSYTVQMEGGRNVVYRRNEINIAGASEGMRISGPPSAPVLTELNYHTRCGLMQTDGASIQYPPTGCINSINRYNWFINVNRTGHRFDGDPGGEWGIVYRCVSAMGGHRGYRFKGDNHEVYHNLSMDNRRGHDMSVSTNKGPKRDGGRANLHSRVLNNAVQSNDLQKNLIRDPRNKAPNWSGVAAGGELRKELRDPDNLDFRPRKDSVLIDAGVVINQVHLWEKGVVTLNQGRLRPLDVSTSYLGAAPDIGAYEFGDSQYRIPGRIRQRASRPIPPNGSRTVKRDADLMWLEGRDATQHRVYVGSKPDDLTLVRQQANNIYVPTEPWHSGQHVTWRVDTVTPRGIVRGEAWMFTVENE